MGLFDIFKKKKKEFVYKKQMEVLFCFMKDTFTCADMLDLMEKSEEFKPAAVSRERDFVKLVPEIYDELKNADAESNELLWERGLSFLDENSKQRLYFHTVSNKCKFQALHWRFDSVQFFESPVFKKLITHNNFVAAYCYNDEDDFTQNLTSLEIYKQRGIQPLATRKNWLGQIEVDIDKNPGRRYLTPQTWLVSSWRMWFGKNIHDVVDREKIRRFDKAWSIKELENSIISVQLYENHEDFDNANSRQIQMSFKEWMEFEKLVESHSN